MKTRKACANQSAQVQNYYTYKLCELCDTYGVYTL